MRREIFLSYMDASAIMDSYTSWSSLVLHFLFCFLSCWLQLCASYLCRWIIYPPPYTTYLSYGFNKVPFIGKMQYLRYFIHSSKVRQKWFYPQDKLRNFIKIIEWSIIQCIFFFLNFSLGTRCPTPKIELRIHQNIPNSTYNLGQYPKERLPINAIAYS
jgi:hypothetical protein